MPLFRSSDGDPISPAFKNEDNERIKPALTLTNANPFLIVGAAVKALRKAGASEVYVGKFMQDVVAANKALDYDDLLEVLMRYFSIE